MQLAGDVVVLRPVTPDDVDALERLFEEPAVKPWWHGYNRERIQRDFLDDDDEALTVYVVEVDQQVAGVIQSYEETEPEYLSAGIDISISTQWHGRGVAVDALRTLARYLIDERGHHHLTIDPALHNERAIACYRKVGFRDVGVLRQNELGPDGTFHDALLMDLLAGELK
jgi:aminoglycoside 6'-N-acetyltransferase